MVRPRREVGQSAVMKRSSVSESQSASTERAVRRSDLLISCHRLSRALLLMLVMERLMCDVDMSEEAEMQRLEARPGFVRATISVENWGGAEAASGQNIRAAASTASLRTAIPTATAVLAQARGNLDGRR